MFSFKSLFTSKKAPKTDKKKTLLVNNAPEQQTRVQTVTPEHIQNFLKRIQQIYNETAELAKLYRSGQLPDATPSLGIHNGPIDCSGISSLFRQVSPQGEETFSYFNFLINNRMDPLAQQGFYQMVGNLYAINKIINFPTQTSGKNLPQLLDASLVRTCFYAGCFHNYALSSRIIKDKLSDEDLPRIAQMMKHTMNIHLEAARNHMFFPHMLDKYLPIKQGFFLFVELGCQKHDGQEFLNSVYFPANHAKEITKRTGAKKMTHNTTTQTDPSHILQPTP